MSWSPAEFLVAWSKDGTRAVLGYIKLGLGLHQVVPPSPKGRRPGEWVLTHLGSGHRICLLIGSREDVLALGDEIAEAGDWTFMGLNGWRNQFPKAPERMRQLQERHPKRVLFHGGPSSEQAAQAVAAAA